MSYTPPGGPGAAYQMVRLFTVFDTAERRNLLNNNLTSIADAITSDAADIAANTVAIAANTSAIGVNTLAIAANVADIATNTADIATNTGDIATNASGISDNVTAITALQFPAQTIITDASYNVVVGDNATVLNANHAVGCAITIPAALVPTAGFQVLIRQVGAGATTVSTGAGADLNGVDGGTCTISAQWKSVSVTYVSAAIGWVVEGAHGGVA